MYRGYIKYWRKIKEWSWYKDPNTKSLFLHLVAECNHKPYTFMGHTIERGQVVCGRKQLSFDLGISEQSLRTSFSKLKSTSDLTIKSTSKFSIVSIANYEIYQSDSTIKSTSKSTFNQPAINQHLTTIKECKNERSKDRARFTPPSLEAVQSYCSEISAKINPAVFFDHYTGNGWVVGKSPMRDWKATVRNWDRRESHKHSQTASTYNPNRKLSGVA